MESNLILKREANSLISLALIKMPKEGSDMATVAINGLRVMLKNKVPKSDKKGIDWLIEVSSIMLAEAITSLSPEDKKTLALKLAGFGEELYEAVEREEEASCPETLKLQSP